MEDVTGALGDQQALGDHLPPHDLVGAERRPCLDHRLPMRTHRAGLVEELVEATRRVGTYEAGMPAEVLTSISSARPGRVAEVGAGDRDR